MVYFGYKERMIKMTYAKKRIEEMSDLGRAPNELIKAENWFVDELVKRFNLDRETLEKLID